MQDSGQISPCGYCIAAALPAIDRLRAVWTDYGRKNSSADGRGVFRRSRGYYTPAVNLPRLCGCAKRPTCRLPPAGRFLFLGQAACSSHSAMARLSR